MSVGGNLYSVPDATRRRIVKVHTLAEEVRIFEDGALIATHLYWKVAISAGLLQVITGGVPNGAIMPQWGRPAR